MNNSSLKWDDVFANLADNLNSQTIEKPASIGKQITIATYLSENVALLVDELGLKSEAEKQEIASLFHGTWSQGVFRQHSRICIYPWFV